VGDAKRQQCQCKVLEDWLTFTAEGSAAKPEGPDLCHNKLGATVAREIVNTVLFAIHASQGNGYKEMISYFK
jgi:hypothetical protein